MGDNVLRQELFLVISVIIKLPIISHKDVAFVNFTVHDRITYLLRAEKIILVK